MLSISTIQARMTAECVINNWLVDTNTGALIHQQSGEQRRLGEYQLKLLIVMLQHADQILTREELTTMVWERRIIGSNSLPNAIHALRAALEDDGKQQRIIKTIPKKGYVLDGAYCHFLPAAAEPADASASESAAATEANPAPTASWPQPPLDRQRDKRTARLWQGICLLQLAILALAVTIWYRDHPPEPRFEEHQAGVYQQIRLLQLEQFSQGSENSQDEINSIIGATLVKLDSELKDRHVKMDAYFHASATLLNFTISLRSRCDQRELAMNIFHWRQYSNQLNTLIYKETERRLNEMAICVD